MKARVQGYPRYYHMWAHLHIGAVCKSTSYRRALAGVDFRSPFKKKGFLTTHLPKNETDSTLKRRQTFFHTNVRHEGGRARHRGWARWNRRGVLVGVQLGAPARRVCHEHREPTQQVRSRARLS